MNLSSIVIVAVFLDFGFKISADEKLYFNANKQFKTCGKSNRPLRGSLSCFMKIRNFSSLKNFFSTVFINAKIIGANRKLKKVVQWGFENLKANFRHKRFTFKGYLFQGESGKPVIGSSFGYYEMMDLFM